MSRVAVVGSGPAGCAAAIALCRAGAHVVLLGDGADAVGEQLHPAARPLLERLGIHQLTDQLACVGVRAAWRSGELHDQDFLGHPFGNGWLLDRTSFGALLRGRAAQAGAVLRMPTRLLGVARDATHGWQLRLSDGELRCDWIVDASGRRGAVARLLGVKRRRFDTQMALVGWLATERDDDTDATLTVETSEGGWWYSCRLPGQRRVAGWIGTSRPDARRWEDALRQTRHLRHRVAGYRVIGPPVVRAADSSLLARCWGPRWIAIGDAAASYDPLASRGMVGALASGLEAASLVGASEPALARWQTALEERFARYLEQRAPFYA